MDTKQQIATRKRTRKEESNVTDSKADDVVLLAFEQDFDLKQYEVNFDSKDEVNDEEEDFIGSCRSCAKNGHTLPDDNYEVVEDEEDFENDETYY
jgi:hypothetical protein